MAADVSRIRNNPLLDHSGLELKQGGVLLDADANELVAIVDRRVRALAGDVLGRATVGANTPDAFRITLSGNGLQIGRGRLYVDGLLAENHGASNPAQSEFDDLLAETRFAEEIPYDAQPYLPQPPALPESGRHLVYLDTWDREVTHLENPDLVETAVGVETSSRRQLVWQVRVLAEGVGRGASCESPDEDIPGWLDLIAPSTGRLTTGTYEVSAVPDPCELPPTGGYRGLENQLYRVEIHDGGQPGAGATFKWSRENASVGSRVSSIVSDSALELESLGRDQVLRLNSGDWVEITDDVREFSQAPGEVRKITVDEAARRIAFTPPLPASMLPASFPDSTLPKARNLRVRRWDQKGIVLSASGGGATAAFQDLDATDAGVIDVPPAGTVLLLEHGITVEFDSIGAKGFRPGDFWVFAARTADGSIELLDSAAPRGIHHHYARLAIWDVNAGSVTDCRNHWPPEAGGGEDCACSVCVTPESHASGALTIQAAVDRIHDAGGTVCLTAGEYVLREPVRLARTESVRVKGQGAATVVVAPAGGFLIEAALSPAIEDLQIVTAGTQAAVSVRAASNLSLQRLVILALSPQRDRPGVGVALAGTVVFATIRDNFIFAPFGIQAPPPAESGETPVFASAELRITDNFLVCERTGLLFDRRSMFVGTTRLSANTIGACRTGGIRVLGLAAPGASVIIAHNNLNVRSTGIMAAVDALLIEGNRVAFTEEDGGGDPVSGIALISGLDPDGPNQCQILANQIAGFSGPGISNRTAAPALIIKQNIIERCGSGIESFHDGSAGSAAIENNTLVDIELAGFEGPAVLGIAVSGIDSATIAGNTIRRLGTQPKSASMRLGIGAQAVRALALTGNAIFDVAPAGDFVGIAGGILLVAPYGEAEVALNQVARDSNPATEASRSLWVALGSLAEAALAGTPVKLGALAAVRLDDGRSVVLGSARPFVVSAINLPESRAGGRITARGNRLQARGGAQAVEITVADACVFADNHCELLGTNPRVPSVRLEAESMAVTANRVRGGEPSMQLAVDIKRMTVVGNITANPISANGPLPAPWNELNVTA